MLMTLCLPLLHQTTFMLTTSMLHPTTTKRRKPWPVQLRCDVIEGGQSLPKDVLAIVRLRHVRWLHDYRSTQADCQLARLYRSALCRVGDSDSAGPGAGAGAPLPPEV